MNEMCLVAGGFSVFAGVGERTREGNDLYKEMIESVGLPPSFPTQLILLFLSAFCIPQEWFLVTRGFF